MESETIINISETETENILETPVAEDTEEVSQSREKEDDLAFENNRIPTIPQLCVALGILTVILGSPYLMRFLHLHNKDLPPAAVVRTPDREENASVTSATQFKGVTLEAEAAYVWDVSLQRALFTKNAQAQLPLASLTKLMTALVTYEAHAAPEFTSITKEALNQEGNNGFHEGDTWNTKKLLDFTLMTSSNDGAYALAGSVGKAFADSATDPEKAFVKQMNAKSEEIGLSQTYFTNPTGLDASEAQSGSYGSARDMAFLMEYIVRNTPTLLEETRYTTATFKDSAGLMYAATNTNQHIESIDNPLGSKTGYTDLAGGNLVVALDVGLNHAVVISVLHSTKEGRFSDVQKLIQKVREMYRKPS